MDKYIGIQFFPVMDFTRVLFTSLNAKAYKYALCPDDNNLITLSIPVDIEDMKIKFKIHTDGINREFISVLSDHGAETLRMSCVDVKINGTVNDDKYEKDYQILVPTISGNTRTVIRRYDRHADNVLSDLFKYNIDDTGEVSPGSDIIVENDDSGLSYIFTIYSSENLDMLNLHSELLMEDFLTFFVTLTNYKNLNFDNKLYELFHQYSINICNSLNHVVCIYTTKIELTILETVETDENVTRYESISARRKIKFVFTKYQKDIHNDNIYHYLIYNKNNQDNNEIKSIEFTKGLPISNIMYTIMKNCTNELNYLDPSPVKNSDGIIIKYKFIYRYVED